jgi:hypothetical protein
MSISTRLGPKIANPQIVKDIWSANHLYIRKLPHLRKVRKSKKIEFRKFADLPFAELVCGPPNFDQYTFSMLRDKELCIQDRRDSRIVPASTSLSLSMCPSAHAWLGKILLPPLVQKRDGTTLLPGWVIWK